MTATARAVTQSAAVQRRSFEPTEDWCLKSDTRVRAVKMSKVASGEWDARFKFRANPRLMIWVLHPALGGRHSLISELERPLYELLQDIARGKYAGKTTARGRRVEHGYIITAPQRELARLLGCSTSRISRVTDRLRRKHAVVPWDLTSESPAPGPRHRHESGPTKVLPSRYFLPDFRIVLDAVRDDANVATVERGGTRYAFISGFSRRLLTPEEAREWNLEAVIPERGGEPERVEEAPAPEPVPVPVAPAEPENPECVAAWDAIAGELRWQLGADTFETWFAPCEVLAVEDGLVTLGVPHAPALETIEMKYGAKLEHAAVLAGYSRVVCKVSKRLFDRYLETDPFLNRPQPPQHTDIPSDALLDELAQFTGSRDRYLETVVCELRKRAHHLGSPGITDDQMIGLWQWAYVEKSDGKQQKKASWFQQVVGNHLRPWINQQQKLNAKREQADIEQALFMMENGHHDFYLDLFHRKRENIWFHIADRFNNRGSP